MFEWIKKHIFLFSIICLTVLISLVGVPFIINLLFKFNSNISFLEAEWSAGDALGYYGAVLSFIGTVVLGALALYQNHIIKVEADKKATLLEEQDRIENMPRFNMKFKCCYGFGCRIGFSIRNLSKNISYEIKVYDIRIKSGETTLWDSKQIYKMDALDSNREFEINLDSPEIKNFDNLILIAHMACKDKYNEDHEYILKMHCSKPNNYSCDDIKELT